MGFALKQLYEHRHSGRVYFRRTTYEGVEREREMEIVLKRLYGHLHSVKMYFQRITNEVVGRECGMKLS